MPSTKCAGRSSPKTTDDAPSASRARGRRWASGANRPRHPRNRSARGAAGTAGSASRRGDQRTKSGASGQIARPRAPVAVKTELRRDSDSRRSRSRPPRSVPMTRARVKLRRSDHRLARSRRSPVVVAARAELDSSSWRRSRETVEKEYGPMYITHLKLDTTPVHRDKLIKLYNRELVGHRLINLGGYAGFHLDVPGGCFRLHSRRRGDQGLLHQSAEDAGRRRPSVLAACSSTRCSREDSVNSTRDKQDRQTFRGACTIDAHCGRIFPRVNPSRGGP